MLNKSSLAEFIKKHSFAIELSFLLAFIALYFVPSSFIRLDRVIFFFPFSHFTSIYNWLVYNNNIEQRIRIYYSAMNAIFAILYVGVQIFSIIYFIKKRKASIYCYIVNIIFNILASLLINYLGFVTLVLSLFILIIFTLYRWYQFSLRNGYWISPRFKIHRKQKRLSNKQRIELLEKEIEDLKKGNQE